MPTRYHQTTMPEAKTEKTTAEKPPIYLLDTMAFIFRAYHAMQRSAAHVHAHRHSHGGDVCLRQHDQQAAQGLPAAVSRRRLRRRRARPSRRARQADEGRQEVQHQDAAVRGRSTTPATRPTAPRRRRTSSSSSPTSAARSRPSASRSSSYEGFEADDVIGTLSCKLSALGHTSSSSPPTRT